MYKECRHPMDSICVEIEALNINDIKEQLFKYLDEGAVSGFEESVKKAREASALASQKADEASVSAARAANSAAQAAESAARLSGAVDANEAVEEIKKSLNNYYMKKEVDEKISKINTQVSSLETSLAGYQTKDNLVTTITAASSDKQYPSAKAVYNIIGSLETLLSEV